MKLKCIKSNDSVFKVGKLYDVINQFGSFYSLKPDSERWPKGYTLQGKYLAFEIYKPKEKKQITVEQALEDGFVKTKSLKRCLKEELVDKNVTYFTNDLNRIFITPEMRSLFGQILQVKGYNGLGLWLSKDKNLGETWSWPLPVIER